MAFQAPVEDLSLPWQAKEPWQVERLSNRQEPSSGTANGNYWLGEVSRSTRGGRPCLPAHAHALGWTMDVDMQVRPRCVSEPVRS